MTVRGYWETLNGNKFDYLLITLFVVYIFFA